MTLKAGSEKYYSEEGRMTASKNQVMSLKQHDEIVEHLRKKHVDPNNKTEIMATASHFGIPTKVLEEMLDGKRLR